MTELAVIENQTLPEPFSEGQARVLDKRIQQAHSRVTVELDKMLELVQEAARGQIHVALGFPSWLDYLKNRIGSLPWEGREQRKALAGSLAGTGISKRAAAAILGVTEGTIRNDLEGTAQNSAVTGADGRTTTPNPHKSNQDIIDTDEVPLPDETELEPEPEEGEPERTADDLIAEFIEEIDTRLLIDVQALKDALDDELFDKARKRMAQRRGKKLVEAIDDLQTILDTLLEK